MKEVKRIEIFIEAVDEVLSSADDEIYYPQTIQDLKELKIYLTNLRGFYEKQRAENQTNA